MSQSKSARLRSRRMREAALERELRRQAARRMSAQERLEAARAKQRRARNLRRRRGALQAPAEDAESFALPPAERISVELMGFGALGGIFSLLFAGIFAGLASLENSAAGVFARSAEGFWHMAVPLGAAGILGVFLWLAGDNTELKQDNAQLLLNGFAVGTYGFMALSIIEGTMKLTEKDPNSWLLAAAKLVGIALWFSAYAGVAALSVGVLLQFLSAAHRGWKQLIRREAY